MLGTAQRIGYAVIAALLIMTSASQAQLAIKRSIYDVPGLYLHFFDPDTQAVIIELCGGGGPGGGASSHHPKVVSVGDGGGAGAWLREPLAVVPKQAEIVVANGGIGIVGAAPDGENTIYRDTLNGNFEAQGGSEGGMDVTTTVMSSNNGEAGKVRGYYGGAEVGGASLANAQYQFGLGGHGGSSPFGQAYPGVRVTRVGEGARGRNGGGRCSGGSGAASIRAGDFKGGDGADGLAIIWEYTVRFTRP